MTRILALIFWWVCSNMVYSYAQYLGEDVPYEFSNVFRRPPPKKTRMLQQGACDFGREKACS